MVAGNAGGPRRCHSASKHGLVTLELNARTKMTTLLSIQHEWLRAKWDRGAGIYHVQYGDYLTLLGCYLFVLDAA